MSIYWKKKIQNLKEVLYLSGTDYTKDSDYERYVVEECEQHRDDHTDSKPR